MAEGASLQHSSFPQVVATAFIQQYVHIQQQCPELLHKFYGEISKISRPNDDGTFSVTTTMQGINEKILSMNYGTFRTEIRSIDAQESLNTGVDVLVTGCMLGKDNVIRNFVQTFFLAPQKNGYFVLNDMFRFVENTKHNNPDLVFRFVENTKHNNPDLGATNDSEKLAHSIQDQGATSDVEALPILEQVHHPVHENHASEQTSAKEEVNQKELKEESDHLDDGVQKQEEEKPAADVHELDHSLVAVVEVPKNSHVVDSNVEEEPKNSHVVDSSVEEEPKKSYASIVMDMKGHSMPSSPLAPQKSIKKNQEPQVNHTQTPVSVPQSSVSDRGSVENVNNQEGEAEGYSIYVRGLPWSVTLAQLKDVFSEFGPIKKDGIQVVKSNTQLRFCYGFVEFEVDSAVQKAIQASPIEIDGYRAYAEEKRSTYSRNNRFRPPPGGGDRGSGFRNEGVGRGGRGGYHYGNNNSSRGGYARDYSSNRSEYGRDNTNNNRSEYGRDNTNNNNRSEYGRDYPNNSNRSEYGRDNSNRSEYGRDNTNSSRSEYGRDYPSNNYRGGNNNYHGGGLSKNEGDDGYHKVGNNNNYGRTGGRFSRGGMNSTVKTAPRVSANA